MQRLQGMARGIYACGLFAVLLLAGCTGQPPTQAQYTGGGGIGSHQDHRDVQGKSSTNTGESSQARGVGQVLGSGTQEPDNSNSPTESNGGSGGSPQTYPLAIAQGKTTNDQNPNTSGR